MKKGLALSIVIAMIVAFIGITVFIMFITTDMNSALNTIYCNTFVKIINFIPFVETPGTPEVCHSEQPPIKTGYISETDNKIFSRILLGYIITCWNDVETLHVEGDRSCYELRISGEIENVTEYNISEILNKENHCIDIENSDYGCGAKNQILWNVEGEILSLNKSTMVTTLNNETKPSPIPITNSMIPVLSKLSKKSELETFLKEEVPNKICSSINLTPNLACLYSFNITTINFNIINTSSMNSQSYNYNIDEVISSLEKKGNIYSPINTQTVLLVKYDSSKDCIMVKG
jgi:hypothetical protein